MNAMNARPPHTYFGWIRPVNYRPSSLEELDPIILAARVITKLGNCARFMQGGMYFVSERSYDKKACSKREDCSNPMQNSHSLEVCQRVMMW